MAKQQTDTNQGGRLVDGQGRRQVVLTDVNAARLVTDMIEGGTLADGDGREYIAVASDARVVSQAPLNVKAPPFNAKGDGSTDDTAAIQNAGAQANAAGGGAVDVPPGIYKFSQLNFDGFNNVRFRAFSSHGAKLLSTYTGAGSAISCKGTTELHFEKLTFDAPVAYTGDYLNFDWPVNPSDCQQNRIRDCIFGANDSTHRNLRSWVRLNHAIINEIKSSHFLWGTYGIVNGDGNYGIANTIDGNTFNFQGTASIASLGGGGTESTRITNNTFEPLENGKAGAILQSNAGNYSTTVADNWFGDVSVTGGTYITLKSVFGGKVTGNRCATLPGATDVHIGLNQCQGMEITGNRCENGIGVDTTPSGAGYCYAIFIAGNDLSTTVTPIKANQIATGYYDDGATATHYNSALSGGKSMALDSSGNLTLAGGLKIPGFGAAGLKVDGVGNVQVTTDGSNNGVLYNNALGNVARWGASGLGFYGAALVAQAARAGQLTDNTGGTVSGTLAAGITDAVAKNAIASLAAKVNALETIIHNLGLSA
jgi:hypothetical protein